MKVLNIVARLIFEAAAVVVIVPTVIVALLVLIGGALGLFFLWLSFEYLKG
jgi:hypothetical protein